MVFYDSRGFASKHDISISFSLAGAESVTTFTSAKSCCLIATFDTEAVVHMDLHHNFNGFTLKWILLKTCLGGKGYQHGR